MSVFSSPLKLGYTGALKSATIRDFNGGWNVIDNDLNLTTSYQKTLKNLFRDLDGAVTLRFGTRWFADISSITNSRIIHMVYLGTFMFVFTRSGYVLKLDGTGTISTVAAPTGSGAGTMYWAPDVEFVSTTEFKGELIAVNGRDKPLLIKADGTVAWLQDLGSGSNANVPICTYVTTTADYVIMAGNPTNKTLIHFSNKKTSGTWEGDAAPNDGTTLDVGSYLPRNGAEITGIASYNNALLVFFEEGTLIVRVGDYSDDGVVHEPKADELIPQFGAIGHHTAIDVGDDVLFCDLVGVSSVTRNVFALSIVSDRMSHLIDPEIQSELVQRLKSTQRERCFAVFNRLAYQYLLFIPNEDSLDTQTETRCYAFTINKKLKVTAWSEFRGWNWSAAARSALGRVFFAEGPRIYVYGDSSSGDRYYADYIGDHDREWTTETEYTLGEEILDPDTNEVYECFLTHTSGTGTFAEDREANPGYWSLYEGDPIAFDMEFPWQDFQSRSNTKSLKYISLDTQGTARFDVEFYVDNIRRTADGADDPTASLTFVAGDAGGYGSPFGAGYGGGRRASDERLWAYTAKFKIGKLRIHGETRELFKLIAVTMMYTSGGIRR